MLDGHTGTRNVSGSCITKFGPAYLHALKLTYNRNTVLYAQYRHTITTYYFVHLKKYSLDWSIANKDRDAK